MKPPLVTVSCAFYGCHDFVADAVRSILAQTVTTLRIIVVNDGDTNPPWEALKDFTDPRLVRFDLPVNRGPYFAHEVVLRASDSPYFAVQDADDISHRHRLEDLLVALELSSAVAACSDADGRRKSKRGHVGLQRTDVLKSIGGYYGGYRCGWDTLLMSALEATGKIIYVPKPLYWVRVREDSLTRSPLTGTGSDLRKNMAMLVAKRQSELARVKGKAPEIRKVMKQDITAGDLALLGEYSAQLRTQLGAL